LTTDHVDIKWLVGPNWLFDCQGTGKPTGWTKKIGTKYLYANNFMKY